MSEPRSFEVQLVHPDGTSSAGAYVGPSGELPSVNDVPLTSTEGRLASQVSIRASIR
jgi:hypothetical protein